jgi:uncharacterized protein YqgC (DUF456 family)
MSAGWKMTLTLVSMIVSDLVTCLLFIRAMRWLERKFGKDKTKSILGVVGVSVGIFIIVAPYFYLFLTWPR